MRNIPQLLGRTGVALAFAALTAPAHALVIEQNRPFSLEARANGPVDVIGQNVTGLAFESTSVLFDLFDWRLGTLDTVKWRLTASSTFDMFQRGQAHTVVLAPNQSIAHFDVTAQANITGTVGIDDGLRGAGGLSFVLRASDEGRCEDPANPLSGRFCFVETHGSALLIDTLSADPSLFIGPGKFSEPVEVTLDWATRIGIAVLPPLPLPVTGQDSTVSGEFEFSGTLSLSYHYTPLVDPPPPPPPSNVPLPATPLLLGAGLVGLLAGRRRKQKRQARGPALRAPAPSC